MELLPVYHCLPHANPICFDDAAFDAARKIQAVARGRLQRNSLTFCAICMTISNEPVRIEPCHHEFCADCTRRCALKAIKKCPLCRCSCRWPKLPKNACMPSEESSSTLSSGASEAATSVTTSEPNSERSSSDSTPEVYVYSYDLLGLPHPLPLRTQFPLRSQLGPRTHESGLIDTDTQHTASDATIGLVRISTGHPDQPPTAAGFGPRTPYREHTRLTRLHSPLRLRSASTRRSSSSRRPSARDTPTRGGRAALPRSGTPPRGATPRARRPSLGQSVKRLLGRPMGGSVAHTSLIPWDPDLAQTFSTELARLAHDIANEQLVTDRNGVTGVHDHSA